MAYRRHRCQDGDKSLMTHIHTRSPWDVSEGEGWRITVDRPCSSPDIQVCMPLQDIKGYPVIRQLMCSHLKSFNV